MELKYIVIMCIASFICGFVAAEILQYRKQNKGKISWTKQ